MNLDIHLDLVVWAKGLWIGLWLLRWHMLLHHGDLSISDSSLLEPFNKADPDDYDLLGCSWIVLILFLLWRLLYRWDD